MKLPKLRMPAPTFESLRIVAIAAAVFCAALAVYADNRWFALFDAAVAGFNLGTAFFCTYQIRMQRHIQAMSEAFQAMAALNGELIMGKVEIIMQGGDPNDDTQHPSLH